MEEDLPRKKVEKVLGAPLDNASIDELEEYIGELEAEIERVKVMLAKRADVKSAAEALFKKMS